MNQRAESTFLPLVLMAAAPLVVVGSLFVIRSVWLTFLLYHFGICLAAPLLASRFGRTGRQGRAWLREHLRSLGLRPRGRGLGLALGAGLALAIVGAFAAWGRGFLGAGAPAAVLGEWGVETALLPALFAFMLLGNGFAEELFWRGWLHERLRARRPRPAVIAATAACYASYHVFTVAALLRELSVVALFSAAILAAGAFWGWLRERTESVWPALLSHAGATTGYMFVLWRWVLRDAP